jgi:hypothetical protein
LVCAAGWVVKRLISERWIHGRAVRLSLSIVAALVAGCTRAELEHKADAYNQAIAESNNRQILLNAVRASQRAPMSFVGFGDVSAAPNWSGSAAGAFNFDPLGLTTYNVNPSVSVNGGFTSFTMNNLNNSAFAASLQHPLDKGIASHFDDLKFPKELVQLIFVQEYTLSARQHQRIASEVAARCAGNQDPRTLQFCEVLSRERAEFEAAGCRDFPETGEKVTVLNSGRDRCTMTRFQTFERQLRLLNLHIPFTIRTGQGILYYLGELIAAQNYSAFPFTPEIFVETPDGRRRTVPLFEVKRGTPGQGAAAVAVSYNGESFYIPTPAFGAIDEARSLQVLDIVSQIITTATSKDALPKSSTVTLVQAR